MATKKTARKKASTKRTTASRQPSPAPERNGRVSFDDELPSPQEVRAARELLERAAAAYASDLTELDRTDGSITQHHLAVAREFETISGAASKMVDVFKATALDLRDRVEKRAEALAEDPLNPPDDMPVEQGPFTLSYKRNAGRSSMSWRDKAKELRIQVATDIEGDDTFDADKAEKWAEQETKAAPKGDPTYTPKIEVRA